MNTLYYLIYGFVEPGAVTDNFIAPDLWLDINYFMF